MAGLAVGQGKQRGWTSVGMEQAGRDERRDKRQALRDEILKQASSA